MNRLDRERRTVAAMIHIYCRDRHASKHGLCAECTALLEYTETRLSHCPFHAEKPTCAQCAVHCYQPERREQIRVVMRHAGPRMLWHHPFLSMGHMLDGFRRRQARRRSM